MNHKIDPRQRALDAQAVMYLAAAGATVAALLACWMLDAWLGNSYAPSLLLSAVALSVWFGGFGPSLLTAGIGYLAADYLFISPRGELALVDAPGMVGLVTYLVSCAAIIGLGAGLHVARRGRTSDLERHRAELERLERRKDRFLAMLAHELRNPLAPLLNSTQVLRRRAQGKRDLQDACSSIERQVRHVVRLVDDLHDVSRIESGRLCLDVETIDLASAVANAVEMARPQIEGKGQRLVVSIALEHVLLRGDFTRLTQVFVNLLINAARYTAPGGNIALSAFRPGNYAVVSIRDNGMGIPAHMLPRVFDSCTQSDPHELRAQGEAGIGLWLVRKLLDLHGASIEVYSEGVGMGSEFIVRIPVPDAVSLDRSLRKAQ